jgi:hypothetical protein
VDRREEEGREEGVREVGQWRTEGEEWREEGGGGRWRVSEFFYLTANFRASASKLHISPNRVTSAHRTI